MKPTKAYKIFSILCLTLLTALSATTVVAGGERANTIGISMGRTFVAASRGLEAIGNNPANLALGDHDRTVTFTIIPSFGINVGSDFLEYEIYNEYFTGVDSAGTRISKRLTDADKERILSIFPAGLGETRIDFDARLFGLTIHSEVLGSIGIAMTERFSANIDIPQDYARFIFYGLDSAGSSYDFSGTDVRAWWLREYSLSYARTIPHPKFLNDLKAGITLKLVHGFAYIGTDHYNAHFSNLKYEDSFGVGYRLHGDMDFLVRRSVINELDSNNHSFTPFPNPAGTGFGFDLGISTEIYKGIRAAISFTNIGSITWSLNTEEIGGSTSLNMTNLTSKEQQDSLEDAFKGDEREIGEFSTSLPTSLRLGAAFQMKEFKWMSWLPGHMLIAVEYQQGFNKTPGNITRPRFALGTEYRIIKFFPIRTGISVGGADRFNWAAGFGLDFSVFNLNVGTENIALLFTPNSLDQFSFGFGMIFRI